MYIYIYTMHNPRFLALWYGVTAAGRCNFAPGRAPQAKRPEIKNYYAQRLEAGQIIASSKEVNLNSSYCWEETNMDLNSES